MVSQKFKKIDFNNRKKQLHFTYASGKKAALHYSQLGITTNIKKAWVDKETRGKSIGLEFSNGKKDYVPYDQPLSLIKDTDTLLQQHIELIIASIKTAIKEKHLSKKYLAEQLETSDNQIQRLLNPLILNKNLSQLYQIGCLLNLELKLNIQKAA